MTLASDRDNTTGLDGILTAGEAASDANEA